MADPEELQDQPQDKQDDDVIGWLAGLDDTASDTGPLEDFEERKLLDDVPSSQEPEPVVESTDSDLPSWLDGLDDDTGKEKISPEGDLPSWISEEDEPEPAKPEPVTPADWKPAEVEEQAPQFEQKTIPPPPTLVETGSSAYQEPVSQSRSGMAGLLSPAQDPLLVEAQNELTCNNIPVAMDAYSKLIKKGKMLDEVIFDLREALYRYPVEVSILQTLGDAYMRANRLQDALDAYTKAEELLR